MQLLAPEAFCPKFCRFSFYEIDDLVITHRRIIAEAGITAEEIIQEAESIREDRLTERYTDL